MRSERDGMCFCCVEQTREEESECLGAADDGQPGEEEK